MFGLLLRRRFLPLFVAQFLGAMNDNLFKNAVMVMVAYRILADDPVRSGQMNNLAMGLLMLPMIALSYLSGQMSDKFDRSKVAQGVKLAEFGLAALGAVAIYLESLPMMLIALLGFGTHSTFFGPVKYALLPQHLRPSELVSGNAMVEAGTFLAILIGTIVGGWFILSDGGAAVVSAVMLAAAAAGYMASRYIPKAPPPSPDMKLSFNPLKETAAMVGFSRKRSDVWLCIVGISWFWLIGSLFLAQFPNFNRDVLRSDNGVMTLFMVAFAIGIAFGSMLCGAIIRKLPRPGPILPGALGMTAAAVDLYLTSTGAALPAPGQLMETAEFLATDYGVRILLDLFLLAACGGAYIVPLYSLLQTRADPERMARTIACNNVVNSIFMVAAALIGTALLTAGLSVPEVFLAAAIMNLAVAMYIFRLYPFSLFGLLFRLVYRMETKGLENCALAGDRVLIISNHTSFIDAALVASVLPWRVAFAVNTFIARRWWLKPLLCAVDSVAMDPSNPLSAKTLIDALKGGKRCMIFPEGRITVTGALMKVYEGPGMIADRSGAMILPVRIEGAQYTPFSRMKGKVKTRLFPKITLTFLPPRRFDIPDDATGRQRRNIAGSQLYDLMSGMMFDSSPREATLMRSLVAASLLHGGSQIAVEDQQRTPLSYSRLISSSLALSRCIGRIAAANEKRIGLMLPNTTAAVTAFFAVQALGRSAAMINYTASPAHILSACRSAQIRTVISSWQFVQAAGLSEAVEAMRSNGARVEFIEDMRKDMRISDKLLALAARIFPELAVPKPPRKLRRPENAEAVVLFTSGSEGLPKGVALSHSNIVSNRYQLASRIDFGPQDVVFNCLPIFHAFGLTGGTLLPLLAGIRIFLYPSPLHYRIVPELIYDTNATILFGTDTFLSGYARFAHPYDFYSLRYVFAGAEKLKDETRRAWSERFGVRIFEGYGATETSPVISVNTSMHYRAGTVGRVLPGIETKTEKVDGIETGGKLLVKGANVMLGYLKEDAPGIIQPPPDGWYDTGDIVDVDEDGFIIIKGRTKRFAKIGGEMVSLAAVEAAVDAMWPGVPQAVVSVPDQRKGEAIVVVTESKTAAADMLVEHFRRHGLPALALPSLVIRVEKLPLLGTGKTDYVEVKNIALRACL